MTTQTRYPRQMGYAWRGNWEERLYERVRERGFSSVTEFCNSRPSATLLELADELGPADVAAVQVQWRLVAEAKASDTIEHCARDLLVRALRYELPEGWHREWIDVPGDPSTALFRKIGAFSTFACALPEVYDDATERVRVAFNAADIPEGWLPAGPDDPVIVGIFSRCWPEQR